MRIFGAFLLLLVACLLVLSAPASSLKEDKYTDLAGHNLTYLHGPNSTAVNDPEFFAPTYGVNFQGQVRNLDLGSGLTLLWVSETQRKISVDVLAEMYDRVNKSGGDVTKAVLGNVTVEGITWRTVVAPRRDGKGFKYVAMIAYTNGQKTATVIMDESRSAPDPAGFNQTLEYVRFEQDPKTSGLPLAYFF